MYNIFILSIFFSKNLMHSLLNHGSNRQFMRETTSFCDESHYFNSVEITGLYISPWTNFEFLMRTKYANPCALFCKLRSLCQRKSDDSWPEIAAEYEVTRYRREHASNVLVGKKRDDARVNKWEKTGDSWIIERF